jgi:hypothetical protein
MTTWAERYGLPTRWMDRALILGLISLVVSSFPCRPIDRGTHPWPITLLTDVVPPHDIPGNQDRKRGLVRRDIHLATFPTRGMPLRKSDISRRFCPSGIDIHSGGCGVVSQAMSECGDSNETHHTSSNATRSRRPRTDMYCLVSASRPFTRPVHLRSASYGRIRER